MARKRIEKLSLQFVSLCDAGDNGPAEVVIHKSRDPHNLSDQPSSSTSWGMPNKQPTGQRPSAEALAGLPDDVAKYLDRLEEVVISQEDEISKMKSEKDDENMEDEKDGEDLEKVLKTAPPALAAIIRKQHEALAATNERLEASERVAKAEREARIAKEFRDRAASDFSHLGQAEEVGSVLKAASEKLGDDEFGTLISVLKRANAGISELFVETGFSNVETDSLSRLDATVAKVRSADPNLSEAEVLTKAMEMDPKAYDAWNADFMKRGGR